MLPVALFRFQPFSCFALQSFDSTFPDRNGRRVRHWVLSIVRHLAKRICISRQRTDHLIAKAAPVSKPGQ